MIQLKRRRSTFIRSVFGLAAMLTSMVGFGQDAPLTDLLSKANAQAGFVIPGSYTESYESRAKVKAYIRDHGESQDPNMALIKDKVDYTDERSFDALRQSHRPDLVIAAIRDACGPLSTVRCTYIVIMERYLAHLRVSEDGPPRYLREQPQH